MASVGLCANCRPLARVRKDLQAALRRLGLDFLPFHSRLGEPFEREQPVKHFTNRSGSAIDRIIAISAFGMGIDVPSMRLVIYRQLPASVKNFLQEIGRAGRDGLQAVSVVLHDNASGDRNVKRRRCMSGLSGKDGDRPVEAARENRMRKIDQVSSLMRNEACSSRKLLDDFGGRSRQPR